MRREGRNKGGRGEFENDPEERHGSFCPISLPVLGEDREFDGKRTRAQFLVDEKSRYSSLPHCTFQPIPRVSSPKVETESLRSS